MMLQTDEEGLQSPIAKNLHEKALAAIVERTGRAVGRPDFLWC